jgi:type VI secretion system protein ImpC
MDIRKDEFASDPLAVSQLLRENGPWAVIASFYAFGAEDVELMTEAARIGRRCGVSWLAEADMSLPGSSPAWTEFRQSPEAAWIGLALPRILLRMPYGKATAPCEALDFEELPGKPEPGSMLWANPAPFCAMLLGQAFAQHGWNMRPGAVREIGGLPVRTET